MDNAHPDSITDDDSLIGDEIYVSRSNDEMLTDLESVMIYNHLTADRQKDKVFRTRVL